MKATETALNRHIAHSAACFKAWQDDLLRLTSTNTRVDGSINQRSATLDERIRPDSPVNNLEVSIAVPSIQGSEEMGHVEDVDDAHSQSRYSRGYPVRYAVEILGEGKTNFEIWEDEQSENEWAPFRNQKEWDLAQWLFRNVGQKSIDEFLKLPIVSVWTFRANLLTSFQIQERAELSFHNTYSLLKKIDQLPTGPDWVCDIVKVSGDLEGEDGETMVEELELWRRNPVECIQELIGNPSFKDKIVFEPAKFFTDEACSNRLIDEAWTADWWWKAHVSGHLLRFSGVLKKLTHYQKKIPKGGAVAPVILASDKTQLTQFRGDKSAWPVYLTLGNIEKATRRQVRHNMKSR